VNHSVHHFSQTLPAFGCSRLGVAPLGMQPPFAAERGTHLIQSMRRAASHPSKGLRIVGARAETSPHGSGPAFPSLAKHYLRFAHCRANAAFVSERLRTSGLQPRSAEAGNNHNLADAHAAAPGFDKKPNRSGISWSTNGNG
jgi:hypothetical protein